MKTKFLIFIILFFVITIRCTSDTTPVYWDNAFVEISLVQTDRIDFFIPDQGDTGWHYWDPGVDTVTVEFVVKNVSDKEVSLEGIHWSLYATSAWVLYSELQAYVPPVILPANDSATIQVGLIITEGTAQRVDSLDGISDFSGTGTFRFNADGYDNERYESFRHNYVYNEMSVAKP